MKGGEGAGPAGGPGDVPSFVETKERELETGQKRWEERRDGEKEREKVLGDGGRVRGRG